MTATEIETQTRAFYKALDANDPGAFKQHFTPDAVMAFNDVDPVVGVQQITDFVAGWKSNFASIVHDLTNIAVDDQRKRVGLEIGVTYVFTDDRTVGVKGAAFLDFQDGLISTWNVYVDTSRLS